MASAELTITVDIDKEGEESLNVSEIPGYDIYLVPFMILGIVVILLNTKRKK